jgi:hypothetical protein
MVKEMFTCLLMWCVYLFIIWIVFLIEISLLNDKFIKYGEKHNHES